MFLKTSGSDVLVQMWQVIKALAPLYALCFGLLGARALIDKIKAVFMKKYGKYFPSKAKKKKKTTTTPRPKRSSVFVANSKNPRVRRTEKGIYIHFD